MLFSRIEGIELMNVKMPSLLEKNKRQLSTDAAIRSRIVTKVRWVEVLNSFLKNSFKARNQVPNIALPHTYDDYRIAGALINKFFKRLFSDKDDHESIVANMKSLY